MIGLTNYLTVAAVLFTLLLWLAEGARENRKSAGRMAFGLPLFVLTLFALTRWPTGNLWDALIDPWLWIALLVFRELTLGTQEAAPCHWMNQAYAEGAEEALKDHGGLRAKILSNGILRKS